MNTSHAAGRNRPRNRILIGVMLGALLGTGACDDSPTAPADGIPADLVVGQSSIALESLQETFSVDVRIVDGDGATLSDVPLEWSIEDPAIVSHVQGTTFRSTANGITTLRVRVAEGYSHLDAAGYHSGRLSGTVSVHVQQRAAHLVLGTEEGSPISQSDIHLWYLGQEFQLDGWMEDALGNRMGSVLSDIWWYSDDPSVSLVHSDGAVSAAGGGVTTITGSTMGLTGSVVVNVDPHLDLAACVQMDGVDSTCGTARMTFAAEGY